LAEYRPRAVVGLLVAFVWFLTAGILAWLGFLLGPEDREALDGFVLLLFTIVPIRTFSWTMALVFLWMGVGTVHRIFIGEPALALSEDGIRIRTGRALKWREIESINLQSDGILRIDPVAAQDQPALRGLGRWLSLLRTEGGRGPIFLSSHELGASTDHVAQELSNLASQQEPRQTEV
jgi:hypothetical protein